MKLDKMKDFSVQAKNQDLYLYKLRSEITDWVIANKFTDRADSIRQTLSDDKSIIIACLCNEFEKYYCMYTALHNGTVATRKKMKIWLPMKALTNWAVKFYSYFFLN